MFSADAYIFFKFPKDGVQYYNYQPIFTENLLFAIIPLVNLIFFAGGIHTAIYKLDTKIEFKGSYKIDYDDYLNLEEYTKGCNDNWPTFLLIVILDVSATIILSIPYLFLDIAFTILIF